MKSWIIPEGRLRLWIWAAGAILSLGGYFVHATSRPRHTPVGTERRLFGLGKLKVRLLESPTTRQWVMAPEDVSPYWRVSSTWTAPSRRWAPFQVTGTWRLERNAVWKVWSLEATGWLDDRHLYRHETWGSVPWILDLARRRVALGEWSRVEARHREQEEEWPTEDDSDGGEHGLSATLDSVLEELAPDVRGSRMYRRTNVGGKRYYLVYAWQREDTAGTLYAVSDELTPRALRLAKNALPLRLSHDGRTLFFLRERALWRLDLRRSLPRLLAEMPVPELPDPLRPERE